MLAGGIDDGRTVHQVGTQHLVLDLDLVERQEEGVVADKQLGTDRVWMGVEQSSCGKCATTLFQAQRRILREACGHSSTKA